ncbi:S-adenosylmethionine mitochondrial carrier protein isoform X2 [Aquila chrysaetos chrysaetos]|uniref:S-adenosylmethionine mitochondrial carrier protein isoform X2 n=1 Tax=Aquila chrysaetos chrysaetos TaxID=223781 RepID=UPI001B7D36B3|nr:S-adenosylmethionine mitochondrial carrier protein isoform X2 [Aquila chrysaetos chrysaetos]
MLFKAGGVAGVCVDLILFPLDTVKTRLQSPQGFRKAGGFRGIYAGVPSTAIGSFPNAAAFFITYENVKSMLHHGSTSYLTPATHMVAASLGEVVACLIRVPSEVVKQRAQVSPSSSTLRILSHTLYHEGIQGLYRGYKSTVLREIPFSLVQFPLWESLKDLWSWKQGHVVDSWQSAVCGAFAGGFAAAVTTPLDVAKTRIMLAKLVCRCCPTDGSHQPGRLHLPGDIREDSPAAALTQPGRSCRWPPKSRRSRRVGGGVRPRTQPSSGRPFAVPQQLFSRLRAAFAAKEK